MRLGLLSTLSKLTVTTANTHWGRMLYTSGGLEPVAKTDVLLLQEVTEPEKHNLEGRLRSLGFEIVHLASRFGLVIAIRTGAGLKFMPNSAQEHLLQKMRPVEQKLVEFVAKHSSIRERGLIAAKFIMTSGRHITIANTHPTTPVALRPRDRAIQISRLSKILGNPYYDGVLILAGDMNHYPKPKRVDEIMRTKARLVRVDIGTEPTWYARGSKQEKWLKIPARLLRRSIDDFNGQHDAVLYRGEGMQPTSVEVMDIPSDHRAVSVEFTLPNPST